ncbi:MAG: SufD family Fe-S cluster assembly protein [Spirochaetia bacterium]|nr:SufD family Fe-S cluster assembly protein [Spirochaetia bacterium]
MSRPFSKENAEHLFPTLDLPSRDSESWRKVNLSGLDIGRYTTNGTSILEIIENAGAAIEESAAQLDSWTGPSLTKPEDVFESISYTHAGRFLRIISGHKSVVRLRHKCGPGVSLIHNVFAEAPEGTELTLIEEFEGRESSEHTFWNSLTTIDCKPGSIVRYLSIRRFLGNEWNFHRLRTQQHRDSNVHASLVHNGGFVGKTFVNAAILEQGATFRGVGITTLAGREFLDVEMVAEHRANDTSSSLHYKTVLKNRAHSVFNGNLVIPPGTARVQSHQINNNILLDRSARAESQPRLIIQSDDVSAEHGATVGEIDPDALFLLMSRGLPEPDARQLLMTGFLTQIAEELPLSEEEKNQIIGDSLRRLYELP